MARETNPSNSPDLIGGARTLPDNYPSQYIKNTVVNGRPVLFRPIRPDDNDLMQHLFQTFSKETVFHRFFAYLRVPPARLDRFTRIDYRTQMAIVAQEEKDGQPVLMGVARYNTPRDISDGAELAIVMGDPWQGMGIGTALLAYLLEVAGREGFKSLYGLVHYDNAAVPRVFHKLSEMGRTHRCHDTGTELKYIIDLNTAGET
jgi:acetyltransferase